MSSSAQGNYSIFLSYWAVLTKEIRKIHQLEVWVHHSHYIIAAIQSFNSTWVLDRESWFEVACLRWLWMSFKFWVRHESKVTRTIRSPDVSGSKLARDTVTMLLLSMSVSPVNTVTEPMLLRPAGGFRLHIFHLLFRPKCPYEWKEAWLIYPL